MNQAKTLHDSESHRRELVVADPSGPAIIWFSGHTPTLTVNVVAGLCILPRMGAGKLTNYFWYQ